MTIPMPDLNDVYRKFGEVAEAAQLVETELGNLLFMGEAVAAELLSKPDPALAKTIYDNVNKQTSGQMFKKVKDFDRAVENLDTDLNKALTDRNRLFHSFYREHNFRLNSSEGCQIMLYDLEKIHDTILNAFKKLMLLSGIDLESDEPVPLPTGHLKL